MQTIHPYGLLGIATLFALLPIVCVTATAYVKISIVLGLIRNGIGAQQVPNSFVLMALSAALSLLAMTPVIEETIAKSHAVNLEAVLRDPTFEKIKTLLPLVEPLQKFLSAHVGERELLVLSQESGQSLSSRSDQQGKQVVQSPGFATLLTGFLLTELKQGFAMGFVLLLPFLVIDLVVANLLVGMGMFMVSPAMISLPLKLMLFVACDGWLLLAKGLLQ